MVGDRWSALGYGRAMTTDARQRNAVSEGFALGLLMCGRHELPNDKLRLESAFRGAYEGWAYRDEFPRVLKDTGYGPGLDLVWVMLHGDSKLRTRNLHWERSPGLWTVVPNRTPLDGASDLARSIDGDVPAEAWSDLARAFLDDLEAGASGS